MKTNDKVVGWGGRDYLLVQGNFCDMFTLWRRFMGIYICQTVSNCIFQVSAVYCMLIIIQSSYLIKNENNKFFCQEVLQHSWKLKGQSEVRIISSIWIKGSHILLCYYWNFKVVVTCIFKNIFFMFDVSLHVNVKVLEKSDIFPFSPLPPFLKRSDSSFRFFVFFFVYICQFAVHVLQAAGFHNWGNW